MMKAEDGSGGVGAQNFWKRYVLPLLSDVSESPESRRGVGVLCVVVDVVSDCGTCRKSRDDLQKLSSKLTKRLRSVEAEMEEEGEKTRQLALCAERFAQLRPRLTKTARHL